MSTYSEIIQGTTPVLVDFFATWCGPCKMMPPILDEVKIQLKENIRILKIDVDKNQALAQKYKIQGVPTLILFKEGKIAWRQSGVIPAKTIEQEVRKLG